MSYLFEHGWKHERERLAALESGDARTIECLAEVGVEAGWHCLEVGAGAGSIARLLCERVGASGRVVATDLEVELLGELDAPNLEVRRHDILKDPLEVDAFHLVHARKVLEHLPDYTTALQHMIGAARPGGWIVVEDPDLISLFSATCSDVERFARTYRAFIATMEAAGYQAGLGTHLGRHLRAGGLEDVQVRASAGEWTGAGERPSVFMLTFEKIRERVVSEGRLPRADVDWLLSEIRSPEFRALTAVHFIAWGRKP